MPKVRTGMNRRSFFRQSAKGLAGIILTPIAAKLLPVAEPVNKINTKAVRFIRIYEHGMDIFPSASMDVLFGFALLDPNRAVQIHGELDA